ncbi:MAG TPA: hypothetical protein VGX23_28045 [Actinocrinis sp.]|nr:hypothetical protein [Actinocrinis sp.]
MNPIIAAAHDVAWPHPATIVLRRRALHPAADAEKLSRFGDRVWFTSAADVDNHRHAPSLNFTGFPAALQDPFKAFALAVLDHERPASLLAGSPGAQTSLSTLGGWIIELRALAGWMHERGIEHIRDLTADDLELYRTHIIAVAPSGGRRADHLHAVRALWAYRDHLPAQCRLPPARPWGQDTARQLAGHTEWSRYNKIVRIAPATMEALLAWSLRFLEDFGPDIRDALHEQRTLMNGTHPTSQYYREHFYARSLRKRLEHYLPRLAASEGALPGQVGQDGTVELACGQLARILACDAGSVYRQADLVAELARRHQIPIAPDAPLGTVTGQLNKMPWRDRPIGLSEIDWLVKALRVAVFVTICYLSGMRPGEVLRLRRGCLRQDGRGQYTVTGLPGKGPEHQGVEAVERSWAVVSVVATAVTMAESLTDSPMLFPPDLRRRSPRALTRSRPLRSGEMNADLGVFIEWINDTFAFPGAAPAIPPDPDHKIHAARFRRTLAYFVVRRPGGLIAAALQYGHVRSKVTLGYAGEADTSWLDDLALERLELVIDQADDDLTRLRRGEHVSGPSADEYRRRLQHLAPFAGRVVDKARNVERLLKNTDPDIHHGQGMTCVFQVETALCRAERLAAGLPANGPDQSQCRTSCTNLAYTDRDAEQMREQRDRLAEAAGDPLSPAPLRDRARAQADQLTAQINRHQTGRPGLHETKSEDNEP